jgi:hypothetical protein
LDIKEKEKLIDHLTKEIEVQNNNMMTFRTRANLPVFLGPFILFGSVVIGQKRTPVGLTVDALTITAIIGLAASYLAMGLAAARIEVSMATQCDTWRRLIAKIVANGNPTADDIEKHLKYSPVGYYGYAAVYFAMFIGFICTLIVVLRLQFPVVPS